MSSVFLKLGFEIKRIVISIYLSSSLQSCVPTECNAQKDDEKKDARAHRIILDSRINNYLPVLFHWYMFP